MGIIKGRSGDKAVENYRTKREREHCSLTGSPSTIEGVEEFVQDNDDDDPSNPASDIRSDPKGPIPA